MLVCHVVIGSDSLSVAGPAFQVAATSLISTNTSQVSLSFTGRFHSPRFSGPPCKIDARRQQPRLVLAITLAPRASNKIYANSKPVDTFPITSLQPNLAFPAFSSLLSHKSGFPGLFPKPVRQKILAPSASDSVVHLDSSRCCTLGSGASILLIFSHRASSHPFRDLWVGQARYGGFSVSSSLPLSTDLGWCEISRGSYCFPFFYFTFF